MISPGQTVKPLVRMPAKDANDCWLWIGATNGDGVPAKAVNSSNVSARRWLWVSLFGTIVRAFEIRVKCGNALCVNPSHMRAVTRAELMQDRSGLTAADVADIKRLAIHGGVPQDILAERFEVHNATINKIVKGTRWKIKVARPDNSQRQEATA